MSYQAALERAIHTLVQKGQSVTVAKLKAQLDTPVPLPLIIQAVKSAKSNLPLPDMAEAETAPSEAMRIAALEQQVSQLTARLSELEERLSELEVPRKV
ncbi:hypothetical protein [Salinivibrio costicola]|uniref:KfrA N-terminal DNA-binding domain-containing protein n=1 Tax=Salinivibrio costicola TaxID=51367 RepID=A0ABX6K5L4_SALCS|nr:hypothetical protein [Salinivibrio costicola]QIR05505.1 hypothetical protein HBA18_03380 [Salinivibrio costicola]